MSIKESAKKAQEIADKTDDIIYIQEDEGIRLAFFPQNKKEADRSADSVGY